MSIDTISSVPPGWTTDPNALQIDYYWNDTNGPGTRIAAKHNILAPKPVMCSTNRTGSSLYMFESGGKVYVWNLITSYLGLVTDPADLNSIVAQIVKNKGAVATLKVSMVDEGQ